jgi:hypothetical protein
MMYSRGIAALFVGSLTLSLAAPTSQSQATMPACLADRNMRTESSGARHDGFSGVNIPSSADEGFIEESGLEDIRVLPHLDPINHSPWISSTTVTEETTSVSDVIAPISSPSQGSYKYLTPEHLEPINHPPWIPTSKASTTRKESNLASTSKQAHDLDVAKPTVSPCSGQAENTDTRPFKMALNSLTTVTDQETPDPFIVKGHGEYHFTFTSGNRVELWSSKDPFRFFGPNVRKLVVW